MADDNSDTDENMTENEENDSDYEGADDKPALQSKKIKRSTNGKWKLYYENKIFKKDWLEMFRELSYLQYLNFYLNFVRSEYNNLCSLIVKLVLYVCFYCLLLKDLLLK